MSLSYLTPILRYYRESTALLLQYRNRYFYTLSFLNLDARGVMWGLEHIADKVFTDGCLWVTLQALQPSHPGFKERFKKESDFNRGCQFEFLTII